MEGRVKMEIVDVLTLPLASCPAFTVNTTNPTDNSVPLVNPTLTPPAYSVLQNASGNSVFRAGDNFSVQSVGYSLPEAFVMAKTPANSIKKSPSIILQLLLSTGSLIVHPVYGADGITVPMENYENVINSFLDVTQLNLSLSFKLWALLVGDSVTPVAPRVSMLGVPSTLNGTVQNVTVFVKVLHNLPLQLNY